MEAAIRAKTEYLELLTRNDTPANERDTLLYQHACDNCAIVALKKIIISINECSFLVKYKFELFALLGLATLMALFWLASIIV